jgi:hypothetical protein
LLPLPAPAKREKQIYWHKPQKSIFYCDDDKRRTEVWRRQKLEYLLNETAKRVREAKNKNK